MEIETVRNAAITSATTVASIAAMSKIINPATAIASATALVSHEFGHYYSALLRDGDPMFPIVIPLGVGSIGVTSVNQMKSLSDRSRRYIINSGPLTGIVATASLIPYAVINPSMSMSVLFVVLAGEIFSWLFGSDGAKLKALENIKYVEK